MSTSRDLLLVEADEYLPTVVISRGTALGEPVDSNYALEDRLANLTGWAATGNGSVIWAQGHGQDPAADDWLGGEFNEHAGNLTNEQITLDEGVTSATSSVPLADTTRRRAVVWSPPTELSRTVTV